MLLLRLWNYIRGYVIILVEGYFLEKFINICIHRQIFLWDIKRQNNSKMTLKVSIKGFKMIRPIAKKTRCRVGILKKRGLPFVLNKYRRRKAFAIGAVAFIVLFYVMTSFIWAIEITGNNKIDTQIILNKLADYGAKPGIFKYRINTHDIVNNMILDMNEFAWVGVSVKGTKIKVNVVERTKPPQLIPKNEPCNIVAYKDGVIQTIFAKSGQEEVKEGDTVTKGQILISGTVISPNKEVEPKQVHSTGTVMARTWYEERVVVSTRLREKVRTGQKKDNYTLVIFSKPIKLFHKDTPFNNYDKIEINKSLALGDLVFPFELKIDRYYEDRVSEKKISLEVAKKNAVKEAEEKIFQNIPEGVQVLKKEIDYIETEDGTLEASVIVECLEDIGTTERIGGN